MGKATNFEQAGFVLAGLGVVMALTLVFMLAAGGLVKAIGVTGANAVARISGILLAALAMQFVFDGLAGSGLFH